jgi:CTP synthase
MEQHTNFIVIYFVLYRYLFIHVSIWLHMPSYIFVAGGVISGIGKGVVTSSIGKLLQSVGYTVTAVKMDPYINIDAGTMRPTEHGEVWVTSDGGEIDQDFGHYERFLDLDLPKMNNITTGQIYRKLIDDERAGRFLGKTVQFIPHVPSEIRRRIERCARGFDICLVEIGGTVGDYENIPFVFAAKDLALDNPSAFVLLVYLPTPPHLGEMKSKPAQHAIKEMRQLGVDPDFIVCRSDRQLDALRRDKIATYQNIRTDHIISAPDVGNIYFMPLVLEEQGVTDLLLKKLGLKPGKTDMGGWRKVVRRMSKPKATVRVAFASKYVDVGSSRLPDAYISINEALKHAGARLGIQVGITYLDASKLEPKELAPFDGLLVPPGFGSSCVDGKIAAIKYARTHDLPFLGICYGMQLAVVEFARNVCGMKGAHTTEVDPKTPYPVVDILPEQRKLIESSAYGGSMRLGSYPAVLRRGTMVRSFYRRKKVSERHRHRYEVNPHFVKDLEKHGLVFSGVSPDQKLMEFMELPGHRCFVATQSHPEYNSRLVRPSPIYLGFMKAAAAKN